MPDSDAEKQCLLPQPDIASTGVTASRSKAWRSGGAVIVFVLIAFRLSTSLLLWRAIDTTSTGMVAWKPCPDNVIYECAHLTVPKDYFNASAGTARIAMLRVPATAPPDEQLGTIFLNPGGPGGSGVQFAQAYGSRFSTLLEGRYNLLGFDPRGIGVTEPRVECFPSTLDYELFKAGSILERGFDIPKDRFSDEGRQHLLDQHRQLLSMQETEYTKCAEAMGDDLRYMSTTSVVRDIEEMSRVLEGPDTPINYFGGSYGTVLGAYLVNMIPEKMGRVLIDGVVSSPQWANTHTTDWLHDWMRDTEKAYQWFLSDCSKAGPEACPLAYFEGEAPARIEARLDEFLDSLYDAPMPVPDAVRPGILNSGGARSVLYSLTNQPSTWPIFSGIFAEALNGNVTPLYNILVRPFHLGERSGIQRDLSRAAVSCGDSPPYDSRNDWPTAEQMVEKTLAVLKDTSRNFGASVSLIEPDGGCQFWPASGKMPERFTGPWNATLKTPMLIVSNTADPITPLASGRELNKLMGNSSRLLIQNSPGHCSLGSVSHCTAVAYRDYFLYGKLPPNEFMCETDLPYFPANSSDDAVQILTEDQQRLHDLSREISEMWVGYVTNLR